MPADEFIFYLVDPLWIIAIAALVQTIVLMRLSRTLRQQNQILEDSLVAASSTELRLAKLQSLRGGTSQVWEVHNVGPNVAFDVRLQVMVNDGRRNSRWIDGLGPSYIDSRSPAYYEASGQLGDNALIKITWTTLNGYTVEKIFAWSRDETGAEHVTVVER